MRPLLIFILALLAASCSSVRKAQRESARHAEERTETVREKADSARQAGEMAAASVKRSDARRDIASAVVRLREEFSAPDTAGRQHLTARSFTLGRSSSASAASASFAGTASARRSVDASAREYDYANHWEEGGAEERETVRQRERPPRWPALLAGAASALLIYMIIKTHLKDRRK